MVHGAQVLEEREARAVLAVHGLTGIVLSSVEAEVAEPRAHQVEPFTEDMAEARYSAVLAEAQVEWEVV